MFMPVDETSSIHDAMLGGFNEAIEDDAAKKGKDGEKPPAGEGGDPIPPDPNKKPDDEKGDGSLDKGSPPPALDEKGNPIPPKPGDPPADKQPVVDPITGKYEGEYTKNRFDGLMGQWQKDKTEMLRLQQEEQKWKSGQGNPPAPAQPPTTQPVAEIKDEDIIVPPEVTAAGPESVEGFKVMMRASLTAINTKLQKERDAIIKEALGQVDNKLTEPERRQTEQHTKVMREITDLTAEFGEEFTKEKKEILAYAADPKNEYQLGELRRAYRDYKRDKAHAAEIDRLKGGKKDVENFEKDKAKQGEIPNPGTNRNGVTPKFDEEKDGDKSLADLFKEGMNA